jgi:hypothetical protein
MSGTEINQAVAAVLVGGAAFLFAGVIGSLVVHPHRLAHPAVTIAAAHP